MHKSIFTIITICSFAATKAQSLQPITTTKINISFTKKAESKTISATTLGGTEMKNETAATIYTNNEIVVTNTEKAKVTTTYKKIKSKTSAMGNEMLYDSENPLTSNKEMVKVFGNIIGSGQSFYINKKGIVTEIDTTKKLAMEEQEVLKQISNISIGMSSDIFLIVNKTYKLGDSWMDSLNDNGTKTINKYKFVKKEKNLAVIEQESKVVMNTDLEQMGMKMKMKLNGTIKGTIKVNLSNALIINKELKTNMSGNVETVGENPMSFPTSVLTTTKETIEN